MADQTRREILEAARRLFAERGYVGTSVSDIADEAGVAVQTIYSRLESKRGMLMGLIDLIDEQAGVGDLVAAVLSATTPADALRAQVRLTRTFQERCGDIIGALFAAAGAEPDLAGAVTEGQRRHREGARLAVEHITTLGGLLDGVSTERATALIAVSTTHEAWRELTNAHGLTWEDAEDWLTEALGRALLQQARVVSNPDSLHSTREPAHTKRRSTN